MESLYKANGLVMGGEPHNSAVPRTDIEYGAVSGQRFATAYTGDICAGSHTMAAIKADTVASGRSTGWSLAKETEVVDRLMPRSSFSAIERSSFRNGYRAAFDRPNNDG